MFSDDEDGKDAYVHWEEDQKLVKDLSKMTFTKAFDASKDMAALVSDLTRELASGHLGEMIEAIASLAASGADIFELEAFNPQEFHEALMVLLRSEDRKRAAEAMAHLGMIMSYMVVNGTTVTETKISKMKSGSYDLLTAAVTGLSELLSDAGFPYSLVLDRRRLLKTEVGLARIAQSSPVLVAKSMMAARKSGPGALMNFGMFECPSSLPMVGGKYLKLWLKYHSMFIEVVGYKGSVNHSLMTTIYQCSWIEKVWGEKDDQTITKGLYDEASLMSEKEYRDGLRALMKGTLKVTKAVRKGKKDRRSSGSKVRSSADDKSAMAATITVKVD